MGKLAVEPLRSKKPADFTMPLCTKPRMTEPSTPSLLPGPLPTHADAKTANGWLHTARFLTTAPQLEHLPPLDVPEIAFVGRSNAGKSTCINTLTQQKRLAFASKTPGRTQSINLFALGKHNATCLLYTSPSPRDATLSRMPSSA